MVYDHRSSARGIEHLLRCAHTAACVRLTPEAVEDSTEMGSNRLLEILSSRATCLLSILLPTSTRTSRPGSMRAWVNLTAILPASDAPELSISVESHHWRCELRAQFRLAVHLSTGIPMRLRRVPQ